VRWKIDQRVSLKLSHPAGNTLGLAVLFFIILALATELFVRSAPVQARVPFQALGLNHVQFEMQVGNLQRFVEQKGMPDCFIIGTSQPLRGIDPVVFSETLEAKTGEQLVCYNFSVNGSNLVTTYLLSRYLVAKFEPRLLVLGTSFLDYTEEREKRTETRFEKSDWLKTQMGDPSLEGYLIEYSYAYRLLKLLSYSIPQGLALDDTYDEANKWEQELSGAGRGKSEEMVDLQAPLAPWSLKNFLREFGKFNLSERNVTGLESILKLAQENGIKIILVEMPYHPSMVDLRDEQNQPRPENEKIAAFIQKANEQIAALAAKYGAPFIQSQEVDFLPDSGWHDRYHLNSTSSPLFSTWLANRVAEAIASRQLILPGAKP
jgi:hypothetical protein